MRIGIDASNILAGGGLNHLSELLRIGPVTNQDIKKIVVWGSRKTLATLPHHHWLDRVHDPLLEGSFWLRYLWQKKRLPQLTTRYCDVLFIPGGTYVGAFHPFVTMSQNLLPFMPSERSRYGFSLSHLRLWLLEKSQASTFRKADGLIFLTNSAREVVEQRVGVRPGKIALIPHGISEDFFRLPCSKEAFSAFSRKRPFKWLYVSIVNQYKHQWHVVEAIGMLRKNGVPLTLSLVGPAYPPALRRLEETIRKIDPGKEFISYYGSIPYSQLPGVYHDADGFVFASSCENMPLILMEAMASGLPIACSNRAPMPEVLGDAGIYFDPEQPSSIAEVLLRLMKDHELRRWCAEGGYRRSKDYSWNRCANETFSFLSEVAHDSSSS